MSDPGKAVFLSYASQDAEAAKRICDALRASGVEVWFDAEGGLEHGDEWDAKIRRQIKECVLFLPVISANTQAREEGYFRIEWELAAQRALGIASGVAFILPIVIDDTKEPDALVPDRFRTVQWTRLRGGELTPEVKARFLKLWSHRTGVLKHVAGVADPGPASARPATSDLPKPGWKIYAGLTGAVIALATAYLVFQPRGSSEENIKIGAGAQQLPATVTPPAAPAGFPRDAELRRAMDLTLQINSIREDFLLAEEIAKRAVEKAPTDPEALTVMAHVQAMFVLRNFDFTTDRTAAARRFCERAVQLAPDNPVALNAHALFLSGRGNDQPRAEELARRVTQLAPDNPFYARMLAAIVHRQRPVDGIALMEENARRFPGDALVHYDLAIRYRDASRYEEAERELDATIALAPVGNAFDWKARFALMHGDLPAMKQWLERMPARLRGEERAVLTSVIYAYLSGDTDFGFKALGRYSETWFYDLFNYTGPKALLAALLHERRGNAELAQAQYEAALTELRRYRDSHPSDPGTQAPEAMILLGLGRRDEARAVNQAALQGQRRPVRLQAYSLWIASTVRRAFLVGDREPLLALLREIAADDESRRTVRTRLSLDPATAAFRDDPEIQSLLGDATKTAAAAGQAPRVWPKHPELRKAIDLIEGTESIPDDFALAEQIVQPIVDRAPTDLEAVTVMARVQSQFMRRGFDRSDERSARARLYGERALQLDPNEPEAMLAVATYLFSRVTGEARAERLLRRAMELDPANPRHGRMLADLLNVQPGRQVEAIAQSQENVRRFPQDALSRYDLARHYKDQGRYEEFDRELDAVLALTLLPNAVAWKARLQFGLHNDFPGMKRWLDQVPERVRGTERAVFGYFLYAAFGGDTETGLEALRAFTQKWFTDFEYAGPTALLNADLLVRQGKAELARQQYEAAWLEIQKMRTTEPARIWLNQAEFWTLLGLGRKEEARQAFRRLVEGQRRPYAQSLFTGWWFTLIPGALLIGERDTALEFLRECVATLPEVRGAIRVRMQLDPRMSPFRDDPEIKALLTAPEAAK